ncbi:MAG TPA: SDR family oxidoreductase [Polyangia bacterium]
MNVAENGLRVIVLGGSGYVGAEVVRWLSSQGHQVVFTFGKGEARAQELMRELPSATAERVDLASFAEVSRFVERAATNWGGLHALVQCAGLAGAASLYQPQVDADLRRGYLDGVVESDWDEMFNVTVKSTFAAVQTAAPWMRRNMNGNIVIVGSQNSLRPLPAPAHFAAAKGALKAFTEAMAKSLGEDGICINLVAPGMLDGGMAKLLPPAHVHDYLANTALMRAGQAREVAETVGWLVTENTYVTGQSILLDGGL